MKIIFCFCVLMITVLVITAIMVHMEKTEQENRLKEAYLQSMQDFYDAIQNQLEAAGKYRHDLAGHIQTLEWILKQRGETAEMKEYMSNLQGRYQQLRRAYYCRDEIIDSVLLFKKQQCDVKNIPLEIKVENEQYGNIDEYDKVGLLHNLLNNAIEENERIPAENPHGIMFSMGREEDYVWIDVSNYVRPGEKVTFYTKKADKEEHGIGMKIIDSLIEKYHGKREIFPDEGKNLFRCRVWLNVQTDEETGEEGRTHC